MKVYVYYLNDLKFKKTDVLEVDSATVERIKKDLNEGKPIIEIRPGESCIVDGRGRATVITYYQYFVMSNIYKIIIDDVN